MIFDEKINYLLTYCDMEGDIHTTIVRSYLDDEPQEVIEYFVDLYGDELGIIPGNVLGCIMTAKSPHNYEITKV